QTLADDKSFNELQAVIADVVSFQNEDPQALAELTSHIGVTRGELIGWALNRDSTLPSIQSRLEGARVSAAAFRGGYGSLTADEAEMLVQRGVDVDQAQRAFTILGGELGAALPGEANLGFDRTSQLAAVADEGPALSALERVRRRRQAVFEEGGGFAGGTAGIGSAQ
ncbi:MAG: hypothetical protein GY773_17970, partial [Actinomycetia bacterium]|nr:hypothetical protein [Actinomycetes bacterium]